MVALLIRKRERKREGERITTWLFDNKNNLAMNEGIDGDREIEREREREGEKEKEAGLS